MSILSELMPEQIAALPADVLAKLTVEADTAPAEKASETQAKVTALPDPVLVKNGDKYAWQVERDAQYGGQVMFRDVNADGAPFTKDDGTPKRYKRLPVPLVAEILENPERFKHLIAEAD
jgi:hypothetical protein